METLLQRMDPEEDREVPPSSRKCTSSIICSSGSFQPEGSIDRMQGRGAAGAVVGLGKDPDTAHSGGNAREGVARGVFPCCKGAGAITRSLHAKRPTLHDRLLTAPRFEAITDPSLIGFTQRATPDRQVHAQMQGHIRAARPALAQCMMIEQPWTCAFDILLTL
jgi:hypothetical protein